MLKSMKSTSLRISDSWGKGDRCTICINGNAQAITREQVKGLRDHLDSMLAIKPDPRAYEIWVTQ